MSRVLAACIASLLASCLTTDAITVPDTIPVPDASSVVSVKLSEGRSDQAEHVLTDKGAIEKALKIVHANNKGWSKAFTTYPTPTSSAIFRGEGDAVLLVIWFGPGWIGVAPCQDKVPGNLLWDLGPDLQQELRDVLGVGS